MNNGNPSRESDGRRRAGGAARGSHRAGSRGSAAGAPGRHRASGGLLFKPSRLHLLFAAAGCAVIAAAITVSVGLLRSDDPGYSAGNEEDAPLLYSNGTALPEDFADRHPSLAARVFGELESRWGITTEELYDAAANPDGYRVALTLDQRLQETAESTAAPGGVVAVEPGSGAVLCYYGGEDATGADQAGPASPHPPSAVFDMVTAATALENGASIESWWPGEDADVTLTEAVRESHPSAIAAVAEEYGADAVLGTAVDLGLTAMGDADGTVHAFDGGEADASAFEAAEFGTYPVSVIDMATVYATIANDGVHAETHFIDRVVHGSGNTIKPIDGIPTAQAVRTETARDLQYVGLGTGDAIEGREFFGLEGTWSEGPAQSWYVGAIPQLSVAAWVGEADSAGSTGLPVWRSVIDTAIEVREYTPEAWPGAVGAGDDITDGIENDDGSIDPDSEYCHANPDVDACQEEEEPTPEPTEEPTDDEPTEEEPTPEPTPEPTEEEPTPEPTPEPTEEEPTEDCGWFDPDC